MFCKSFLHWIQIQITQFGAKMINNQYVGRIITNILKVKRKEIKGLHIYMTLTCVNNQSSKRIKILIIIRNGSKIKISFSF